MDSTTNDLGNSGLELPRAGYAKRMKGYLAEMYPLPSRLALAALTYFGVVSFLGRIHGVTQFTTPLHSSVGIVSLFSLMLIVRLMDELKDKDLDRAVFPQRPLPSGRIFEADIVATIVVLSCIYLLTNLIAGSVFWIAVIVLAYAFLMFKHFFIPEILRKNLLLTVATHNPMVALVLLYVLALFFSAAPVPLEKIDWQANLLLILMNWAMSFAWEIARKIRLPREENEYVTYSRIFGPSRAVFVAAGAQTVSFAIGLYFYWMLSLSALFLGILATGYAIAVWGHIRFLTKPSPLTSKLKVFAEAFIVFVLMAQTIEHGWLR